MLKWLGRPGVLKTQVVSDTSAGHEYHEYSSIYQSARFPRASERGWIRHLSAVEEPQKESGNEACALSGSKCGGQLLHARSFSEVLCCSAHLIHACFCQSCHSAAQQHLLHALRHAPHGL